MDRFQEHFYNTKKKNLKDPIGKHFNLPNHTGIPDFEIYIVDFIHCHPDSGKAATIRDTVEKHWIHRLRSSLPWGLNSMD
jgi:hypothetical protein